MRSMCNVRRAKLGFPRAAHWAPEKTQVSASSCCDNAPPCIQSKAVKHQSGTYRLRDASFKGRFVQGKDRSFGDTSFHGIHNKSPVSGGASSSHPTSVTRRGDRTDTRGNSLSYSLIFTKIYVKKSPSIANYGK